MKLKVYLLILSLSLGLGLFAQSNDNDDSISTADYQTIQNLISQKEVKIYLLNVVHKGKKPIAIYSSNFVQISNDKLVGNLPYFFRNDQSQTALKDNVRFNANIVKYKVKDKKKQKRFVIKTIAKNKNGKRYKINVDIDYEGYCTIEAIAPNKTVVVYDGRLAMSKK